MSEVDFKDSGSLRWGTGSESLKNETCAKEGKRQKKKTLTCPREILSIFALYPYLVVTTIIGVSSKRSDKATFVMAEP